jgi:hypothetical protein
LHHFGDVVDTDDVCAGEDAGGDGSSGGPDTLIGRSRFAVASQGGAEEAFAGSSHQEWITQLGKLRKFGEQFIILREAFAEADAGIEDDLGFRDAGSTGHSDRATQTGGDVAKDIASEGFLLHGFWSGAHVHENDRDAVAGRDFGKFRVMVEPGDVVEHLSAGADGGFGDDGAACVDGNGDFEAALAQAFKNGKKAAKLFSGADAAGAGPRGFSTNIENVGAGALHRESVIDGVARVKKSATVGEAVGRDVEDAHEEGAFAEEERAGANAKAKEFARRHGSVEV